MKTVVTITGIRPDFIRMSEVFKRLDKHFSHIMIHTGQHYEYLLSDTFFQNMGIRGPDVKLHVGHPDKKHYHHTGEMGVKVIEDFKKEGIDPDLILFLGDANTVSIAPTLKKEGYKIGHIEAGMRSHNEWMPEEINRKTCDHVCHHLYAYTELNRQELENENIRPERIEVVGNTIVEVCKQYADKLKKTEKKMNYILMDIHRHENLVDVNRLRNILLFANKKFPNLPIKMLRFNRTMKVIEENNLDLGRIEVVDLMSYEDFLTEQYHAYLMYSDSGSAQEEAPLFDTPVIVPRDETERPQSMWNNNSVLIGVDEPNNDTWKNIVFVDWYYLGKVHSKTDWLGDGKTADRIVNDLKEKLND